MSQLHTGQFPISPFAAHGRVSLGFDGRVLHWTATGPFNREVFVSMTAMAQRMFELHPPNDVLATMTVVHHSIMLSDDALAEFGDYLAAAVRLGLRPAVTAYAVAPDVEGRNLVVPRVERLYKDVGRPFACFDTSAEALSWIDAELTRKGLWPRPVEHA